MSSLEIVLPRGLRERLEEAERVGLSAEEFVLRLWPRDSTERWTLPRSLRFT